MYLSELFLQSVEHDMSIENVRRAVGICDTEMHRRMGDFRTKEECTSYFFDKIGKNRRLNSHGQEILDFWDVYREFDAEMGEKAADDYELLKVCRLVRVILEEDAYKKVIPFYFM